MEQTLRVTDCNICQTAGMYLVFADPNPPANLPDLSYKWGSLIVFRNTYTVQFYIGTNGAGSNKAWFRFGDSSENMSTWTSM